MIFGFKFTSLSSFFLLFLSRFYFILLSMESSLVPSLFCYASFFRVHFFWYSAFFRSSFHISSSSSMMNVYESAHPFMNIYETSHLQTIYPVITTHTYIFNEQHTATRQSFDSFISSLPLFTSDDSTIYFVANFLPSSSRSYVTSFFSLPFRVLIFGGRNPLNGFMYHSP